MDKIKEILKNSSLSSTLSDMEIDELVEEIRDDFDVYLDEERERIEEEVGVDELNDEISELEQKIEEQKQELKALKIIRGGSIVDHVTAEWVMANWEQIVKLQQMNLNGEEILIL